MFKQCRLIFQARDSKLGVGCTWRTATDWKLAIKQALALGSGDVPQGPEHLTVWSHDHHRWLDKATAAEAKDAGIPEKEAEIAKQTAVMLLLYPSAKGMKCNLHDPSGGLTMPVTMRSSTLRSHAGQMSLPGGKCDAGETPLQAAVRETEEEIGISAKDYEVLGAMPKMWSFVGKCWITPVVGFSSTPLTPVINSPAEVAGLYYMQMSPLLFCSNQTHFRIEKHYSRNWGGRITMPCFFASNKTSGECLFHRDLLTQLPPGASVWPVQEGTATAPASSSTSGIALPSLVANGPTFHEPTQRYFLDHVTTTATPTTARTTTATDSDQEVQQGLVWGLTSIIVSSLLIRLALVSLGQDEGPGSSLKEIGEKSSPTPPLRLSGAPMVIEDPDSNLSKENKKLKDSEST